MEQDVTSTATLGRDAVVQDHTALQSQDQSFTVAQLAPPPTKTEPVNNVVGFLRGAGKTAFDWGGVVANLFRGAAMGSGAELKVLKLNDVLPDDVTERDLQLGGIAAQHAGVTSDQMASWTPAQRGTFLQEGAPRGSASDRCAAG